jgi:putative transposase
LPDNHDIRSCVFTRDAKGWYVSFQLKVPLFSSSHNDKTIGIDVGLLNLATLSNGEIIPNPRIAKNREKELRVRQRALSRCKKGSKRRLKVKYRVTALHETIANTRRTYLHQQSARLTREYGTIVVEDLKIKNMVKSRLAKSISDASWGMFVNMLTYKVANIGGKVIKVNPRNTSQECSDCGIIVLKKLSQRVHNCPGCGLILDRDENAARNILARGGSASLDSKRKELSYA